jgi:hypothetical protein
MDMECEKLFVALNTIEGLITTQCCCGHGERPFYMWMRVSRFEALNALAKAIGQDSADWTLSVYYSNSLKEPLLHLESTKVGEAAYHASWRLAADIIHESPRSKVVGVELKQTPDLKERP